MGVNIGGDLRVSLIPTPAGEEHLELANNDGELTGVSAGPFGVTVTPSIDLTPYLK